DAVRRITEEAGMALAGEVRDDPGPWAAEFGSVSTERSIAALDIPVLVVHGSDDEVVPVGHAARIASAARNAEVRILEGAPHQLRHVPDAVDAFVAWLEKVLGVGGSSA
ncbi:MAG TPA: alpha/beta hydrolase, partial [Actinomycetota bacterium]|nr:alpha/beta hydrolase [Actinomycetota bacterium]